MGAGERLHAADLFRRLARPLLREAGKVAGGAGRMGCGEQVPIAAGSRRRSCNPTDAEAAGHTPSGAARHLPQRSWGRGAALYDPVRSLTDWTGYIVDRSIAEEGKWIVHYVRVELKFIEKKQSAGPAQIVEASAGRWTCGQREALPTGSTGAPAATAKSGRLSGQKCQPCIRSKVSPINPVAQGHVRRFKPAM